MKILQKIWNFFDQYSSTIILILIINLIIAWIFKSKGLYFYISDITLLVLSLVSLTNSYIKYRKKKILNEL